MSQSSKKQQKSGVPDEHFVKGPTGDQMTAITKEVGSAFVTYMALRTCITCGDSMAKVQAVSVSVALLAEIAGKNIRAVHRDLGYLSAAGYIHISKNENTYHIMPLDPDGVPEQMGLFEVGNE